jgi:hypothetical protein
MSRIMIDDYPNKWHFYRSHFAGNPCAECLACGKVYACWDADDLEAHNEQHETETTND